MPAVSLDRYRVFAAAQHLPKFTIEDLHIATQVSRANIRKLVERDLKSETPYFEETGIERQPKGKPRKQYGLRSDMIPVFGAGLRDLRHQLDEAVNGFGEDPSSTTIGAERTGLAAGSEESAPLVSAEKALLRELPRCEGVDLKVGVLRRAVTYRATDQKLAASTPSLDKRRTVVDGLIRLSILEFAVGHKNTDAIELAKRWPGPSLQQMALAAATLSRDRIADLLKRLSHSPLMTALTGESASQDSVVSADAMESYGADYIMQKLLTVKDDEVEGRTKIYESMVKGETMLEAGSPASFDVLTDEIRGLALNGQQEKRSV